MGGWVSRGALLQPTVKADIEVKNVEFMRLHTSGCKEITVQSYGVSGSMNRRLEGTFFQPVPSVNVWVVKR